MGGDYSETNSPLVTSLYYPESPGRRIANSFSVLPCDSIGNAGRCGYGGNPNTAFSLLNAPIFFHGAPTMVGMPDGDYAKTNPLVMPLYGPEIICRHITNALSVLSYGSIGSAGRSGYMGEPDTHFSLLNPIRLPQCPPCTRKNGRRRTR